MRKHVGPEGWLYVLAVLLIVGLKAHYSTAGSQDLRWILAPTAWLVSLVTNIGFVFSEGQGYVSTTGDIVIAPACAGVNFLIICFSMLVFSSLHRFRQVAAKAVWLCASGLFALVFTLLVNAARIILAIHATALPGPISWFTPERIHRLEGICLYFFALSILFTASEALLRRLDASRNHDPASQPPSRARYLMPLFWYLAVTLGIPLARGSFGHDLPKFVEHCGTVILVPVLLMMTFSGLTWLVNRLLRASSFSLAFSGVVAFSVILLFTVWDPGPASATPWNTGHNGLWAESKWYTGFDAVTGEPIQTGDLDAFATLLATNRIRYVYVRAGQIAADGRVEHMPGSTFFEIQKRSPEVVFLPWLSGHAQELAINDHRWRSRVIQSLGKLYATGVKGVHLDIEPISNGHPGYVDLLKEIRDRFDGAFFVSHATCRVAPVGFVGDLMGRYFWSQDFYRATMQAADQTVLMGYNTGLWSGKLYCAYLKRQTRMLLDWAAEVPNHQVLIGIPSYDRVPFLFDPLVENVVSGSLGVRAALEGMPAPPACFMGVALYANWTTSPEEWHQFHANWLMDKQHLHWPLQGKLQDRPPFPLGCGGVRRHHSERLLFLSWHPPTGFVRDARPF